MLEIATTCEECNCRFLWDADSCDGRPNCPNCGFNPLQQFKQSDISDLLKLLKTGKN